MNEVNNFKNAKVGDKVWCLLNGEGEIKHVEKESYYPIEVFFRRINDTEIYSVSGFYHQRELNPCLFRTPPTVTAPEPKKRVVKKIVVAWYKHISDDEIYVASFDGEIGAGRFCASLEKDIYEVLKTETIEREFEI